MPSGTEAQAEKNVEDIQDVIEMIKTNYNGLVNEDELIEAAIKGIFNALDKYSSYYSEEEEEELIRELDGTYSGIGVVIGRKSNLIIITQVMKGSPAEKAGLNEGDMVLYVNGTNVTGYDFEQFTSLVKGPPHTTVTLTVINENDSGYRKVKVVRDTIKLNPVKYSIMEGDIGYLKLVEFSRYSAEAVAEALEFFDSMDVKKVIVDLRNNPGGLLDQVVDIAGHFVKAGPVVTIKNNKGGRETYVSKLKEPKYQLVVLVNGWSASASEIFAGAVQDTGSGTVIGDRTYGKGSVQALFDIPGGGMVKLTVANFYTPAGNKIEGTGITPDVCVENEIRNNIDVTFLEDIEGNWVPGPGDQGADIYAIKTRLALLGYDIQAFDITMDDNAAEALKKFQGDNGIEQTGEFDAATREILEKKTREIVRELDRQMSEAVAKLKQNP